MTTVNIYLTFNGDCEAAFVFYQSVFGGGFSSISRFKELPPEEGQEPIGGEAGEKIMHISLPLGGDSVLMGADYGGDWATPELITGNNFSLSVNAGSKEEADRIFNGLAEGGKVTMPMNVTFWGEYFGMLTDKFGINRMTSFKMKNN